jgi:CubicO group peptidase (beta-lactamase class C family)
MSTRIGGPSWTCLALGGLALGGLASAHGARGGSERGAATDDFVTGGGWIRGTPTGARGNFGIKGGFDARGFFGHLNYVDHEDGMHVRATSVTAYFALDDTTRQIEGTAKIDGEEGFTFLVVVSDTGEPGRADTFELELSNGYSASGTLRGGNVQLHAD